MTDRDNFISIARRKGYTHIAPEFAMCPDLEARYKAYITEHPIERKSDHIAISDLLMKYSSEKVFLDKYYSDLNMKKGTKIDAWGIAHEPGSAAAFHMTLMHHPMENFDSTDQIEEYPFPCFDETGLANVKARIEEAHKSGKAAICWMATTIWETSWYLRGMENLMCDMMSEDPIATILLDKVTDLAVKRAQAFARAGADGLFLGDDIGMQQTVMMSNELYSEWLKPRLARVIAAAKVENPEILVFYHSCGHVTELIPELIEAGIDVLDPVQPEAMDFEATVSEYSGSLAFHGSIGTQTVMPFGTPEEVRQNVFHNLDFVGKNGGLFVCPTHTLEPEVPLENVLAYIKACEDYTK